MRLRPGLPLLRRGPTQVQVGTDPRWAVTLADLSPSATRALCGLAPGAHEAALRSAFTAEDVDHGETDAVLSHLRAAHLLVDTAPASVEDTTWALLDEHGETSALSRRARRTVRVCGLGRLGTALAGALGVAGVGTVLLEDERRVTRHDVGTGLGLRDVGMRREAAVARLLHDLVPAVRTSPAAGSPGATAAGRRRTDAAELVVLVEHGVADPVRHRDLLTGDVPHLSVVVREASVLLGPLVVPGHSACLRCVDLHRTDLDPGWPTIAAQLAAGSTTGAEGASVPEEVTLVGAAAALAAVQVLAYLDGRPTAVDDAALELLLPEVLPRRLAWPPHPACDCTGPPGPAGTRPTGRV